MAESNRRSPRGESNPSPGCCDHVLVGSLEPRAVSGQPSSEGLWASGSRRLLKSASFGLTNCLPSRTEGSRYTRANSWDSQYTFELLERYTSHVLRLSVTRDAKLSISAWDVAWLVSLDSPRKRPSQSGPSANSSLIFVIETDTRKTRSGTLQAAC